MGHEDLDDRDDWLERELGFAFGSAAGPSPHPGQARYTSQEGGIIMRLWSRSTGVLSAKLGAGLVAAAAALVAGSVAAAAATGNAHPANWGKVVTTAVQDCKAKLVDDQHGIGECVSAVASSKGQEERKEQSPKPSPSPTAETDAAQQNQADGHATGKPTPNTDKPGSEPPGREPSPHPGNPHGPPHR